MVPALRRAAGFSAKAADKRVYLHASGARQFSVGNLAMDEAARQRRGAGDVRRMLTDGEGISWQACQRVAGQRAGIEFIEVMVAHGGNKPR